ncbi:WhiB family transcriptional regulator [Pseudonocardia sp. WMMC193]|uniref:WhiB family transcriptional regulator n=1 Tax=Pseudonocardia sp. WMMC193 TaxID=2911965 RepID=UPI001F248E37|nr:WhiB family transcriptional regulator [Pseudonocardia sp. WMMC193]MCF7548521.1 WhiB family transcriptional regulator [Pseudonocardia sp. WMMC193]
MRPVDLAPKIHPLAAAVAELLGPELNGAACAGLAPAFDSDIDGESQADRAARLVEARRICRTCAVRPTCDQAATEGPMNTSGVWGGRVWIATGRAKSRLSLEDQRTREGEAA